MRRSFHSSNFMQRSYAAVIVRLPRSLQGPDRMTSAPTNGFEHRCGKRKIPRKRWGGRGWRTTIRRGPRRARPERRVMMGIAPRDIRDHPDPLQSRRIAAEWFRHLPAVDALARQKRVVGALEAMRH